jgi:hypothetical protein
LGAGFATGFGFLAGLETPKLKSRKLKPLRSESSIRMVRVLSGYSSAGLVSMNCKVAIPSGAKHAAKKCLDLIRTPDWHPSGPKGHVDFAALMAVRAKALTYQSCPDTKRPLETRSMSFSATCKARANLLTLCGC